jgi:anti-sigma regulatory factor (Ser/Thr protein kinase)
MYFGCVGYPPPGSVFYSTSLPKSPDSAAQARLFLDQIRAQVSPAVLENARLLMSELVANAIEHVREEGEIEVRIALSGGVLRIEVLDPGPGFTPPRPERAGRGWGLHFTDRLASRWAADRDGGARVWFELPLT